MFSCSFRNPTCWNVDLDLHVDLSLRDKYSIHFYVPVELLIMHLPVDLDLHILARIYCLYLLKMTIQ